MTKRMERLHVLTNPFYIHAHILDVCLRHTSRHTTLNIAHALVLFLRLVTVGEKSEILNNFIPRKSTVPTVAATYVVL